MATETFFSPIINQLSELDQKIDGLPQSTKGTSEQNRELQSLAEMIIKACNSRCKRDLPNSNGVVNRFDVITSRASQIEKKIEEIKKQRGFFRTFIPSKTLSMLEEAMTALHRFKTQFGPTVAPIRVNEQKRINESLGGGICFGFCLTVSKDNVLSGQPADITEDTLKRSRYTHGLYKCERLMNKQAFQDIQENTDIENSEKTSDVTSENERVPPTLKGFTLKIVAEKNLKALSELLTQLPNENNDQFILGLTKPSAHSSGHAIQITLSPPCYCDINKKEDGLPVQNRFASIEEMSESLSQHISEHYKELAYREFILYKVTINSKQNAST